MGTAESYLKLQSGLEASVKASMGWGDSSADLLHASPVGLTQFLRSQPFLRTSFLGPWPCSCP